METNEDIIEFRYKLIDIIYNNSNYSNTELEIITDEQKKILKQLLIEFNTHFGNRHYNLG